MLVIIIGPVAQIRDGWPNMRSL